MLGHIGLRRCDKLTGNRFRPLRGVSPESQAKHLPWRRVTRRCPRFARVKPLSRFAERFSDLTLESAPAGIALRMNARSRFLANKTFG
jgi:hypothetical protein